MEDFNARYVLDNINVLVIDDNKHMPNLVVEILHALGVKIRVKRRMRPRRFRNLNILRPM